MGLTSNPKRRAWAPFRGWWRNERCRTTEELLMRVQRRQDTWNFFGPHFGHGMRGRRPCEVLREGTRNAHQPHPHVPGGDPREVHEDSQCCHSHKSSIRNPRLSFGAIVKRTRPWLRNVPLPSLTSSHWATTEPTAGRTKRAATQRHRKV